LYTLEHQLPALKLLLNAFVVSVDMHAK